MKSILSFSICVLILAPLSAQQISMQATGLSTGHIADITIENSSDKPVTLDFPCVEIPSDGSHQRMVAMDFQIEISPGQSAFVDVEGYCLDVDLPAPKAGKSLPIPEAWTKIPPTPRLPIGSDTKDVKPVREKEKAADSVGTKGIAVGEDVYRPAEGHPRADTVAHEPAHTPQRTSGSKQARTTPTPQTVQKIRSVMDVFQQSGDISTPFSGDREKERDIIVQHVIWIAASPDDNPYTLQDICMDMKEQFERHGGNPVSSLTPDEQSRLQIDISNLLDAVNKVGIETGLDAFLPSPITPPALPSPRIPDGTNPEILNTVKATGTGRTTGHIADLTVSNPTKNPITIHVGHGNAFIPSSGQYQPYIVPSIPPISIGPGEKKTVPVNGFCTDIHRPPVPSGGSMPSPADWFTVPVTSLPSQPGDIVIPTYLTRSIPEATGELLASSSKATSRHGTITDCIDYVVTVTPTIPGTDHPIPPSFTPGNNPTVEAPVLLDALNKIAREYDALKEKGVITTPFSGNPEKEREAVIQQTFWIYNDMLSGKGYNKQQFHDNTVKQFEQNTGNKFETLPPQQKESVNKGVDDFWNTFQAVGVEAKVLSAPPTAPVVPSAGVQDFWNGYDTGDTKLSAASDTPIATQPLSGEQVDQASVVASCTCGPITFRIKNLTTGEFLDVNSAQDTFEVKHLSAWKSNIAGTSGEIAITNISVSCPCSTSGSCYFYPRNSDFKEADEDKATVTSTTHKETSVDSWFKPDSFFGDTMKFKIHAWCKGDDCAVNKNCVESFSITLVEKKQ